MRTVIDPKGKNVVLFGAGGAARAVSVELSLAGVATIAVVNRSVERGQGLVDLVNKQTPATASLHVWNDTFDISQGTDIVINATTIGLFPDVDGRPDLNLSCLTPDMVVADGIHNPPETLLIRDARAKGCVALDGLGMLVNQGVIALRHWSGIEVDAEVMRQAVMNALR